MAVDVSLPKNECNPTEAREHQNDNGRGAVPCVRPYRCLIHDEDQQHGATHSQDGTNIVDIAERQLVECLEVSRPREEQSDRRDEGAGTTDGGWNH